MTQKHFILDFKLIHRLISSNGKKVEAKYMRARNSEATWRVPLNFPRALVLRYSFSSVCCSPKSETNCSFVMHINRVISVLINLVQELHLLEGFAKSRPTARHGPPRPGGPTARRPGGAVARNCYNMFVPVL